MAVEKNLEAFLKLDLPGTEAGGRRRAGARAAWRSDYPDAVFLGAHQGEALAEIYAAADVFVFPSRTDTFGLVLLEALASGVPVAAYPAPAPRDVIGDAPVGVLDEDLRRACLQALAMLARGLPRFRARHELGAMRGAVPRTRDDGAKGAEAGPPVALVPPRAQGGVTCPGRGAA